MQQIEKLCSLPCSRKISNWYVIITPLIPNQAKQKRDTDIKQKDDWNHQENHELNYTCTNDFMTENPNTTKSMLADHRVKPYHFKGLNDEQKGVILNERNQQLVEHDMQKKQKEEEDKLWAIQQEQMRRMQVLADRDNKRKVRMVAEGVKETH